MSRRDSTDQEIIVEPQDEVKPEIMFLSARSGRLIARREARHGHREALENVKGQIGACGIWCGSCAVGNGALQELSRRYGELLKGHGLDE